MSVKDTARRQYARIVDRAAEQFRNIHRPKDGWIALLRQALGMSGANVAARMDVSRNAIYQAERNEREGAITIAQMRKIADAMDAEFVYAVIPKGSVEDVIRTQAHRKAEARVRRASSHMALESQSLPSEQTKRRIDDLAEQLVRDMPPDFWEIK
ncbi:mobile mystery protein A [Methyloceanibacter sp.]|uniref:mobile mystery protein A n=1 Tax=Methyloceanibacter sp. TaxID=1965321 RepID=UPI002C0F815B|nr:mobile mystery protein A [Methyloceanibacter sp.]HML91245.1 mobile mystery protein A [Methyloceanibacter sp.]